MDTCAAFALGISTLEIPRLDIIAPRFFIPYLIMPPFKVVPCTLDDALAIARNNISAFWEDKNWVLMWTRKNKSCEYVISQSMHRWPYNLTKDPIHRRHEKVVDVDTGELVGFAVWILPEASGAGEEKDRADKKESGELWPEACGPEVDDETRELLKKKYDEADWEYDQAMDVLDPPVNELKKRLKGDKRWLGEYFKLIGHTCSSAKHDSPQLPRSSS
jgi:hypothetical protein